MKTIEQIALSVAYKCFSDYADDRVTTLTFMTGKDEVLKFAKQFLAAWLEQQSQEPVAWYSHSGTLAYDKKSFPPSTQHLAKPLFLAPQPAIPDWISVGDRLPEEHQEVMCAFGNGNMLILEFDRSLSPYRFIDRDSGKWWSLKIKHWMPLPELPAHGEQEC